jgi:hypothetical protein
MGFRKILFKVLKILFVIGPIAVIVFLYAQFGGKLFDAQGDQVKDSFEHIKETKKTIDNINRERAKRDKALDEMLKQNQ